MASAGSAPASEVPVAGATKSWCMDGMAASEIDPSDAASTGHRAPSDDVEPLLAGQLADGPAGVGGHGRVTGQEGDAGGVVAAGRQLEIDDVGVEVVGDLDEDPGTVPAVLLAAGGPAVGQVLEGGDGLADQGVRAPPCRSATRATPQASCSKRGSYSPAPRGPRWATRPPARGRHRDRGGRVGASAWVRRGVVIGSLQRGKWIYPPGTTLAHAWSIDCTRLSGRFGMTGPPSRTVRDPGHRPPAPASRPVQATRSMGP